MLFRTNTNTAARTTSRTFPVGEPCLLQPLPDTGSCVRAPCDSRALAAACRDSLLPFYGSVKMNPKAHLSESCWAGFCASPSLPVAKPSNPIYWKRIWRLLPDSQTGEHQFAIQVALTFAGRLSVLSRQMLVSVCN